MAKNGCSITFKEEHCEISKNGKRLLIVKSNNDVYKMNHDHQAHSVIQSSKPKCIHEWHKLLGHRNIADIRKMPNLAKNINIASCNHTDECEICIQCKKTRDPFPKESYTRSRNKLDLIHTDVCSPLQIPTLRGNK